MASLNAEEFPVISNSLREFLTQRRERSYKWYEEHNMESLNKLPPLKAATNSQTSTVIQETKTREMMWTSIFDVFFANSKEKSQKGNIFSDNDNVMSYLIPRKQFTDSKHVSIELKRVAKTRRQPQNDAVSGIIADLRAMNMADQIKKIEELVRIKNKTDIALRKMKQKDKDLEIMTQKQQLYTKYLCGKQQEKQKKIREEKRLQKECHTFVSGFAVDIAKRKADAVVSKQRNQVLWNKTFKAALK